MLENDVRFDLGMPLLRENAWSTRRIVLLIFAAVWTVIWAVGLTKVASR